MKNVSCLNCGFLCWDVSHIADEFSNTIRYDELRDYWRKGAMEKLKSGILEDGTRDETNKISCLRHQWVFADSIVKNDKIRYANKESLKTPRKCIYYMKYQPGFSPEEHKQLQREADTNRTIRNATVIGAVIGAVAAILAQFLYAIITK